jgi:hypothetical protein
MMTYTSTIRDRCRWPLAGTANTLLLLFSPSTNCDSSATMAPGGHKTDCTGQTMRCSLICCSLKRTYAPSARSVSSTSTRWGAEMAVCSFNRASILSVTAAGLNMRRKGEGKTVCFVHRAISHQILLPISTPESSLARRMELRSLIHPNCWLFSTT